eukprot:scaffold2818_cov59-Cylindrotheca_fusiformis.AAC.4
MGSFLCGIYSTISRRVSLMATRISRGKHQMPPFPTTAVLLIPTGIHCVGFVLTMVAVLFRRPRTSIRQIIEEGEFGVVVARCRQRNKNTRCLGSRRIRPTHAPNFLPLDNNSSLSPSIQSLCQLETCLFHLWQKKILFEEFIYARQFTGLPAALGSNADIAYQQSCQTWDTQSVLSNPPRPHMTKRLSTIDHLDCYCYIPFNRPAGFTSGRRRSFSKGSCVTIHRTTPGAAVKAYVVSAVLLANQTFHSPTYPTLDQTI